MLKQFLPQLQTTFLKALLDSHRVVRIRAGLALAKLVVIHSRADPMFVELHGLLKGADDTNRETMLQAMRVVTTAGAAKMALDTALTVLATLTGANLLAHPDDPPRAAVGGCLGAMLHSLPEPHLDAALMHHVLAPSDDWPVQHARSCALFVALKETPDHVYREDFEDRIEKTLLGYLQNDRIPVACSGIRGIAYLVRHLLRNGRTVPSTILSQFVRVSGRRTSPRPARAACAGLTPSAFAEHEPPQQRGEAADGAGQRAAGARGRARRALAALRRRAQGAAARARQRHQGEELVRARQLRAGAAHHPAPAGGGRLLPGAYRCEEPSGGGGDGGDGDDGDVCRSAAWACWRRERARRWATWWRACCGARTPTRAWRTSTARSCAEPELGGPVAFFGYFVLNFMLFIDCTVLFVTLSSIRFRRRRSQAGCA